jgi:hypothetical protein
MQRAIKITCLRIGFEPYRLVRESDLLLQIVLFQYCSQRSPGKPRDKIARDEGIVASPEIIQTERNGRQMKTLTLILCGATLLAFGFFTKTRAGETDPAFKEFIQQIKALYTRHPGQALSETESAEVYRLISAEIDREAHLDHPDFGTFTSDKQESIRMEEFEKVRKALTDLQAKGVLPAPIKN